MRCSNEGGKSGFGKPEEMRIPFSNSRSCTMSCTFFCASLKNHYLCSDSPLSSYTNAKMSYEGEAPLLNQSHMRLNELHLSSSTNEEEFA